MNVASLKREKKGSIEPISCWKLQIMTRLPKNSREYTGKTKLIALMFIVCTMSLLHIFHFFRTGKNNFKA